MPCIWRNFSSIHFYFCSIRFYCSHVSFYSRCQINITRIIFHDKYTRRLPTLYHLYLYLTYFFETAFTVKKPPQFPWRDWEILIFSFKIYEFKLQSLQFPWKDWEILSFSLKTYEFKLQSPEKRNMIVNDNIERRKKDNL